MAKIKKWFGSRKLKRERTYEEEKREFEMAVGTPFINIRVEMPDGFEELRAQFLSLEKDERFLEEVKNLVKKRLTYERQGIKPPS
ncbi:hypothetical protein IBX35_05730 [Candidatus Bathyarchaeota archaeon]|nr:hypothetical protein [Candidatus Bathyarchaeota archaeon]